VVAVSLAGSDGNEPLGGEDDGVGLPSMT
jgi:hypothetical protein